MENAYNIRIELFHKKNPISLDNSIKNLLIKKFIKINCDKNENTVYRGPSI